MLDFFAIFSRGGALLWTLNFTALRHNPVDALNALVRSCLMEERSGVNTFTYMPKTGSHQALKWTFHNGFGLVFVAVYQKALSLMYVDELLQLVKQDFTSHYYKPNEFSYPTFEEQFKRMLKQCEARAEEAKKAPPPAPNTKNLDAVRSKATQRTANASHNQLGSAKGGSSGGGGTDGDGEAGGARRGMSNGGANGVAVSGADDSSGSGSELRAEDPGAEDTGRAFDISKLNKAGSRVGPRGRGGKAASAPAAAAAKDTAVTKEAAPKKKEKQARTWGLLGKGGSNANLDKLDYSAKDAPDHAVKDDGMDAMANGVSRMDLEEEEEEALAAAGAVADDELLKGEGNGDAPAKPKGLLGSFMSSIAMRVVGKQALTAEDLQPALLDMKRKLMERNVAEQIAQNICDSIARSLEGQKLASFTGVGKFVRTAFEEALAGILNKRQTDVLLDVRKAQERGRPYVIVFCGVNGVGKSTNLAKIAYWLGQHNIKVLIAACDTFRAGAVEQLKTHCSRLKVPLYERGYEKDPAKVASEAIKQAERNGQHVVLVDTAGRMQDNEPLMRALSSLINVNSPNLVLFVGEALVGNDAVDQLVKFNRHGMARLGLAPPSTCAAWRSLCTWFWGCSAGLGNTPYLQGRWQAAQACWSCLGVIGVLVSKASLVCKAFNVAGGAIASNCVPCRN